jgi:phage terminase large subunit
MIEISAQFPDKLQCLFQPKRYKIFYGGRGGGKSWNIARALILISIQKKIRVLCAREYQNSIKDSVHRLLVDQIEELGLAAFFDIRDVSIACPSTGGEFNFEGIKHNARRIRSYEGIDIAWVEEANNVSKSSWEVLIPTVRTEGSEIWASFNPELETDETYQRFVVSPPSEAFVVKVNWRDNPWFPEVLRWEMEELKSKDYDAYLHIWEGNCREMLEGAVYAEELRQAKLDGRITRVPYEYLSPVETFWDLGHRDATSIWFAQYVAMQYRVIDYYQDSRKKLDHYLKVLSNKGYVYGTMWLPWDAKAKHLGTKRTIEEQVRQKGFRVRIVPKLSVADGINAARTIFPNVWFDEKLCADGLQALRHYKYDIDPETNQFSEKPLHDWSSDAADAFRAFAIAMKAPKLERMEAIVGGVKRFAGRVRSSSQQLDWMR